MSAEPIREVMDDEVATRPIVPDVSRPSKALDHGGGLADIQRTIIRHRLDEAASLTEMAGRLLGDVVTVAGAENGTAAAVRARIMDATALAGKIAEHRRDLGVDMQVVRGEK